MIAIRNNSVAWARGSIQFLYPSNRKVLAWIREHEGERILCVANLSRAPQAVQLDLSEFRTAVPIELTGGTEFPPIGDLPYLLTLPAYGFYWFSLSAAQSGVVGPQQGAAGTVHDGPHRGHREPDGGARARRLRAHLCAALLMSRRWFGAKGSRIKGVKVVDCAAFGPREGDEPRSCCLPRLAVTLANGETHQLLRAGGRR